VIAHVTLLTVLHRIWGAMGLLLGLSTFLLAAGAAAIGVTTRGAEVVAGVTAAAFGVCAVALVATGGANLWAGDAMHRRRATGRTAALTLGVLNLFVLPFGTALAIYTYWVLLHEQARRHFNP
jgi:hypothetical protein